MISASKMEISKKDNKKILKVCYSGLETREMSQLFSEVCKRGLKNPGTMYLLADFSNTQFGAGFIKTLQSRETNEASQTFIKVAVIGINGLSRLFLGVYNKATSSSVKSFPSEEAAMDWISGS